MRVRTSASALVAKGRRRSSGLTLIELLITVAILMIIAAATVPQLKPAIESRRIRESARQIHVYLSSARNLAMATGRPAGVLIERLLVKKTDGSYVLNANGTPKAEVFAMALSQVEVPPPYSGDSLNSVARLQYVKVKTQNVLQATLSPAINTQIVKAGDLVQFNYQGPWYQISSVVNSTTLQLSLDMSDGQVIPWTTSASSAMPYKILRQPVKSSAAPLQLPVPSVIDLTLSGTESESWGNYNTQKTAPKNSTTIMVVFSPNGSLERYYYNGTPSTPTTPIYLLIGKRDQIGTLDLEDLWVAVNPQTGLVSATEVLPGDLAASRAYARQADAMGGK